MFFFKLLQNSSGVLKSALLINYGKTLSKTKLFMAVGRTVYGGTAVAVPFCLRIPAYTSWGWMSQIPRTAADGADKHLLLSQAKHTP